MSLFLLLAACSPVRLGDDTRLAIDLFGADPDRLASPYVVGATFDLVVSTPSNPAGWTVTSTDPDVLVVGAGEPERDGHGGRLRIPATALAAGDAEIVVRGPSGDEALRADARVAAPTRFEVRSATALEADPDAGALTTAPKVLVDGTSAFRVDFFEDDAPLAGAGGLSVGARDGVVIEDKSTFPDDADWVVVTPSAIGTLNLDLGTGDVDAGTLTLESVSASTLAGIAFDRDPESDASTGDALAVVAHAVDTAGDPVFGAAFTWAEDGEPVSGEGDVYRYTFDEDDTTEVTVRAGDLTDTVTVHGGGGSVSASSDVACAVANVGPVGVAILLAGLGAVRRRRK